MQRHSRRYAYLNQASSKPPGYYLTWIWKSRFLIEVCSFGSILSYYTVELESLEGGWEL